MRGPRLSVWTPIDRASSASWTVNPPSGPMNIATSEPPQPSLLDRAKREAILRMKQSCPDADLYLNCRLETSTIARGKKDNVACVEIVAYSTAIKFTA